MIHLDESTHLYERILDIAPQAVDKIQQMFNKKSQNGGENNQASQQNQTNSSYSNQNQKHDLDI